MNNVRRNENKVVKRILITGAVLASDESSKDTYVKLDSIIREIGSKNMPVEVYSPLDTMKFTGNDYERYERAMDLLKDTDIVIAEMSNVSTGQGMELQEAVKLNIPIIIIAKTGSKISGLVKGCGKVKDIIYYDNIDLIKKDILRCIFEELR